MSTELIFFEVYHELNIYLFYELEKLKEKMGAPGKAKALDAVTNEQSDHQKVDEHQQYLVAIPTFLVCLPLHFCLPKLIQVHSAPVIRGNIWRVIL